VPRYLLVNRRANKFTAQEKHTSRAAVSTVLASLDGRAKIVADKNPDDDLARRVVVLDANDAQIASLRATLPPDGILEPLITRMLHNTRPVELAATILMDATMAAAVGTSYRTKDWRRSAIGRHPGHLLSSGPERPVSKCRDHYKQSGYCEDKCSPWKYCRLRRAYPLRRILDYAARGTAFGYHHRVHANREGHDGWRWLVARSPGD